MGDKFLISVKEASDMFGIGEHRIRQIVSEDYECQYHLMLGRVIRIKKDAFINFINQAEML